MKSKVGALLNSLPREVVKYPEHKKLGKLNGINEVYGDWLDHYGGKFSGPKELHAVLMILGFVLDNKKKLGNLHKFIKFIQWYQNQSKVIRHYTAISKILGMYFNIDEQVLDTEKRMMLDELSGNKVKKG